MPNRQEHLRAAKALLGHADPLVHILMNRAIERMGPRYLYVRHNAAYISAIKELLGEDARLEATLHLLQDWGIVTADDYAFHVPSRHPNRK